jgi:hypothetical protein
MEQCPLCQLSDKDHDLLWRAHQQGGYHRAAYKAQENLNLDLNQRQLRRHFEYHRPRQAGPQKIKPEQARQLMIDSSQRRQQIADLLFRVPGLSAETIGTILYWNGQDDKLTSSHKAASRDLRKMIDFDQVYRLFIDHLIGPRARPQDLKGYYFLGSTARWYIQDLYQVKLSGRDWLGDPVKIGDWRAVYPRLQASNAVVDLFRDLATDQHFYLSGRNWVGEHLFPKYKDPLDRSTQIKANGLIAVSNRKSGQLLPALYLLDDRSRPLDELIKALATPLDYRRSGQLPEFLPGMPAEIILPIIVLSESEENYQRLLQARLGVAVENALILIGKRENFNWNSPSFRRLFTSKDSTERSLNQWLNAFWHSAPLAGPFLAFRPPRKALAADD